MTNTLTDDLARKTRVCLISTRERLLGRRSLSLLQELSRVSQLTNDEFQSYLTKRKYKIAEYAAKNSPYYHHKYAEANLRLHDLEDLCGWENIPLITKQELQNNLPQIYSRSYKGRNVRVRTSGSTGVRLVFDVDMKMPAYGMAAAYRAQKWWGIEPGSKWVRIWGSYSGLDSTPSFIIRNQVKLLADKATGVTYLSAFNVSETQLQQTVHRISQLRPDAILGYGTALLLLADYVLSFQGSQDAFRSVKLVVYTSEYLSLWQKNRLSEAFGCPVVSEYGSVETGVISYDCPCGLQHVTKEFLLVEVLDQNGTIRPEGTGEAVITHFFSQKLPLVRYLLGDVIDLVNSTKPCPYGMVGQSIRELVGRSNDIIIAPSGTPIHPELFDYIMRTVKGIRRFQVRECGLGELDVRIETWPDVVHENLTAQVESAVSSKVGPEFHIAVTIVDEIDDPPGHKFRWVIANPNNRINPGL